MPEKLFPAIIYCRRPVLNPGPFSCPAAPLATEPLGLAGLLFFGRLVRPNFCEPDTKKKLHESVDQFVFVIYKFIQFNLFDPLRVGKIISSTDFFAAAWSRTQVLVLAQRCLYPLSYSACQLFKLLKNLIPGVGKNRFALDLNSRN